MTLERFDGIGFERDEEGGAPIDSAGSFEGETFEDVRDLASFLRTDARAHRCISRELYSFAVGRVVRRGEEAAVDEIDERFDAAGRAFSELVVAVATSEGFRALAEVE